MSVHEAMHAYVGLRLGDDTAAEEGRVSLNPLKHIDPFMTVLLPAITLFLFQAPILAAKPVPFNPDRVKYGELGAAMIAAAGPVANLVLAILAVILARSTGVEVLVANDLFSVILYTFIVLNVSLFVFNLIPIPPLDGNFQRPHSASGSSSAYVARLGAVPRISSYSSSVAKHHDACLSSGSAPHSGQLRFAVVTERFRLRASSKRRCRPFFTETTPCPRPRRYPTRPTGPG